MKYYYAHAGAFLKPKNKLEQAVQDLISSYNRDIFKSDDIDNIKNRIENDIEALNQRFANCTSVSVFWWSPQNPDSDFRDWILTLSPTQCVSFALYQSKEVTNENS